MPDLSDILNLVPGVGSGDVSSALLPWAMGTAYKQWQDGDKYLETAKDAMKYGDPFGQDNRSYYQQKLRDSYEHPEQVLMDPAHQATLKSGMDAVSRQDAMRGYLGSGNMAVDLTNYAQNENNKYLSQYRKDLQPLTGYQFDPANAGRFLMQGNEQKIKSQNAALQSMMLPFLYKAQQNHITNNNGGGNGGNGGPKDEGDLWNRGNGTPNPIDWSKYNSTPQQIQKELQTLAKQVNGGLGGGTAMELFQRILNSNLNVSDSTRMFLEDVMHGDLQGNDWGHEFDLGTVDGVPAGSIISHGTDVGAFRPGSIWGPDPDDPSFTYTGPGSGQVNVGDITDIGYPDTPDFSGLDEINYPEFPDFNTLDDIDFGGGD